MIGGYQEGTRVDGWGEEVEQTGDAVRRVSRRGCLRNTVTQGDLLQGARRTNDTGDCDTHIPLMMLNAKW